MAEQNTNTGIPILSDADVAGLKVSELANRPTNSSGYGSHGLSAAEVKARMDGYPEAIRTKLNALIGLFNTAKIPTPLTWGTGASSRTISTLDELVELIDSPDFADNLLVTNDSGDEVTLKTYIQQYRDETATSADKAEGYAVGEQDGEPVEEGSPYYHKNAKYYSEEAASSAESASFFADNAADYSVSAADSAKVSEGYAKGTKNGVVVTSGSPYYHKNAKYYSEEAASSAESAYNFAVEAGGYLNQMGTLYTAKQDAKPDNTHPLIDNGKVSMTYIPDAILGQVEYQGTWNASDGTPAKTFPTTVKEGYYWICKTSGGLKTPDGQTSDFSFEVGDWAIINAVSGSVITWDKVDNTDAVTMVNGHKGAVNTYAREATSGSTYNAGDTVLYGGNLYLVTTQFTFNGSNFLPNVKRYGLSNAEVEAIRDQIPADVLSEKIKGSDIIHANLSEDETEVHIHFDIAEAQNGQVPVYNNGHVHWGNGGGSVDSRQNIPVRYTFVNCGLAEGDTSLYIVAGTQLIVKLQAEEGYALPNEAQTSSGLTATIDTATGEMTVTCNVTASAVEAVTVTAIVPSLETFLLTSNNENLLDADDKYLVF